MSRARIWGNNDDGMIGIYCPGCATHHVIATKVPLENGACWTFNNDFESPTFSPSLLVRTGKYVPGHEDFDNEGLSSICHSFIKEGMIQFLDDCTHELKGQTVNLPNI